LKVKGKETAVVGDGVSDMKCAKAVQAVAIGLPTGVSTRAELENGGAEYILAKISELPELISRINSVTKS
jgi:phosphoglycolate phosphatase-like HAD superfamily hydrolase